MPPQIVCVPLCKPLQYVMAKPAVVKALYRSALRAAAALEAATQPLGIKPLHEIVSRVPLTDPARALREEWPLPQLARYEFRAGADDVAEGLARAVSATTRTWGRAASLRSDDWEPRDASVAYHVGMVGVHRLHGYRFVIAGWTPSCNGSAEWVSNSVV